MVNVIGAEKNESLIQLAPIHSPVVRCMTKKLVDVRCFAVVALVGLAFGHGVGKVRKFMQMFTTWMQCDLLIIPIWHSSVVMPISLASQA